MRRRTTIVLGLAVLAALATPATAARFHVRQDGTRAMGPSAPGDWDPTNCYATLAAAAAAAAPADSVLLHPGVHSCEEPVVLPSCLARGASFADPDTAAIICSGAGRLVLDASAPWAEVRDVVLTGADTLATAGLTVDNSHQQSNVVALRNCVFRGFRALGGSGGSALSATANESHVALQVSNSVFERNVAEGPGGAVHLAAGVDAVFIDCLFVGNTSTGAAGRGGAVAVRSDAAPTMAGFLACEFRDNASSGPGGALSVDNASLHLVSSRVTGSRSGVGDLNDWSAGAGVHVMRSTGLPGNVVFAATGCVFDENLGDMLPDPGNGDGGAVLVKGRVNQRVTVAVERCEFTGNANAQGAGLYVGRFASGAVSLSSFRNNRAWFQGGGAMKGGALANNYGELVTFDYCEFVGNEAGYTATGESTGDYARGGGLMVRVLPRAEVRFCTFVDNRVNGEAPSVGDAVAHVLEGENWWADNQCVILDSVFWGAGGQHVQVYSEGGGVAEAARLALVPGQFLAAGAVEEDFVQLAATPFAGADDFTPAAGSPLIDRGLDQGFRESLSGVPVPQGAAPDIGAYERPAGPSGVGPVPQPAPVLTARPNPFNPRTLLTAEMPADGDYRLVVVDLRGRVVARLHDGRLAAGERTWSWAGTDDAGRDLPAGVYLARLIGPGTDAARKLMLAK